MTEFLYNLQLGISIKVNTQEEADEIMDEIADQAWLCIGNPAVEVWESTTEFKGLGEQE